MPSIFRSNDPTVWDDIDGIYIDESAPPPSVVGVAANIGILVAQSQRGSTELYELGGTQDFHENYGKSTFGMNQTLKNKKFGRLKVIRVTAAAAVAASVEFDSSSTDRIRFTAKQGTGAYGNNIQVKIEAGTTAGKKYTIQDTNVDAVLPIEIYDNVVIDEITASTFGNSRLVTVTVLSDAAEPTNAAFTSLAGGDDGTVADTDYETAIAKAAVEKAGNVIFLDSYNATRSGYLKQHVADTQDKMAIVCGAEGDSVSTAVSAVANLRDTDGRIIYAYPWIESNIDGVLTYQNPASYVASIITQTAPNVSPSFVENAKFLSGVTALKKYCTRAEFVQLNAAGICAFERDEDIGFLIKNAVVTQIINSEKVTISRRRMTDFLTNSAGQYLKNWANAVNSKENRTFVKAALESFVKQLEIDKLLPSDAEVNGGAAKIIDIESLNTDSSVAAGFFRIKWRQRLYSSMRYIVLSAEIGTSVVVTEN